MTYYSTREILVKGNKKTKSFVYVGRSCMGGGEKALMYEL